MIQRIIHRLLLRRHFWRYATFSEVAEIYASRTLRIFALRLVAVFTSVYLFQEGYSLVFLGLFWAAFYAVKVLVSWPSAMIVAWFGPKHGTLFSNVMAAVGLIFLPLVDGQSGFWALVCYCGFQAFSSTLYDMCYLVDFSKVKSMEHAGKEIAFMNIFEKVATGVSPIVGGALAFFYSPQVVMIVSAVLFLLATLPLFNSGEPVQTKRRVEFSGFPWSQTWRSLRAEVAVGFDVFAVGTAWTLFMVVVVFAGAQSEIYVEVGILSSVTLIAALAASYAFGRLIDRRRGGDLLRMGVVLNSVVHCMRLFITTPIGVVLANILNETATTAYSMAFTRGMFDTADMSGRRLAYLFLMVVSINIGAGVAAVIFAGLVWVFGPLAGLKVFFAFVAVAVLIIATPRFHLYRK